MSIGHTDARTNDPLTFLLGRAPGLFSTATHNDFDGFQKYAYVFVNHLYLIFTFYSWRIFRNGWHLFHRWSSKPIQWFEMSDLVSARRLELSHYEVWFVCFLFKPMSSQRPNIRGPCLLLGTEMLDSCRCVVVSDWPKKWLTPPFVIEILKYNMFPNSNPRCHWVSIRSLNAFNRSANWSTLIFFIGFSKPVRNISGVESNL